MAGLAELPQGEPLYAQSAVFQELPGGRCDLNGLLGRSSEGRRGEYERTAEKILAQLAARRSAVLLFLGTGCAEEDCAASVRLAAAMARRVATDVLLLDCTFQDSLFPEPSGRRGRQSLIDVLAGAADWRAVVATTSVPCLQVLRGSRLPGDGWPPEGLKYGPLLEQLRRQYRLVLAFTVASSHPDVIRLARHCDGTYLLVALDHTARRLAKESVRRVTRYGGQVLGCVVRE